jgi:hypothetical protein
MILVYTLNNLSSHIDFWLTSLYDSVFYLKSPKSTVIGKVYRDERDPDVKERILLVMRTSSDKQLIESVARAA